MTTTFTYYTDQELPEITFEWTNNDGTVVDFSSGWTFTAKLVRVSTNALVTSQSSDIVGDDILPNVTLQKWASATLTAIAADLTAHSRTSDAYELRLYARRTADSADDVLKPGAGPQILFKAPAV